MITTTTSTTGGSGTSRPWCSGTKTTPPSSCGQSVTKSPADPPPLGAKLSLALTSFVRKMDAGSGRAITAAYPHADESADGFFSPLDVAGYNYSPDMYTVDHVRKPKRVMVGTESLPGSALQMWAAVWNNTFVIGDFVWTSYDYLGESAIGRWAYMLAHRCTFADLHSASCLAILLVWQCTAHTCGKN